VHSQLSADAACFIPSWYTATITETSTAVPLVDAVMQQPMIVNTAQQFNSTQQAEQW